MQTLKEFTLVGVSDYKGKTKVRYANSKSRVRTLENNGHSNVFFIELTDSFPKEDCIDQLLDADLPSEAARQAVIKEATELGFLL